MILHALVLLAFNGVQEEKAPVPGAAECMAVEKEIHELFKAEYASQDSAVRAKLAGRLIQQAEATGTDPVQRYVLLTEARDLAAKAFDSSALRRRAITFLGRVLARS